MTAMIHRPYFLPWLGYFSKLVYADVFIVMDDVIFTKRHFIDRVKIISPQGEIMWLGLKTGENFNKRCNEISLPQDFCVANIMKVLKHSYSKARYFKNYNIKIQEILQSAYDYSNQLSKFDTHIIKAILQLLSLPVPKIYYSSQFDYVNNPTKRLITLCKNTFCNQIIMGSGGSTDIHDLSLINSENIIILYQDFYNDHPIYYQTRRAHCCFEKGLSILDCIFNEGIDFTKNLLLDKKYKPYIICGGVGLNENN